MIKWASTPYQGMISVFSKSFILSLSACMSAFYVLVLFIPHKLGDQAGLSQSNKHCMFTRPYTHDPGLAETGPYFSFVAYLMIHQKHTD